MSLVYFIEKVFISEVRGFRLTSGSGVFRWAHGFYKFLVELPVNLRRLCIFIFVLFIYLCLSFFDVDFFARGLGNNSIIIIKSLFNVGHIYIHICYIQNSLS